MSGPTYDSEFGVETITTMIRTFDTTAYDKFFSELFRKSTLTPNGDSVSWDEVKFDRDLAPVTGNESPAPHVHLTDRVKRQVSLASIKLYTDISGHRLFKERGPGSLQPNAEEVIGNELQNMRLKIQKTIEFMSVSLLLGQLDMNPQSIPGTDIAVPTIKVDVNAYAKKAPWNDPATKILSVELQNLTTSFIAAAGRLPGFILLNDLTETYLVGNPEVAQWAVHQYGEGALFNNPAAPEVMNGLPLGGFVWKKDPHGFVPQGGKFTRFMPDNQIVVLPPEEQLGAVLAMAEGRGIIPRTAYGAENGNGIIEEAPSPGFYGYATAIENPPGIRLYAGWFGLPVVKFPKAITTGPVI